MLYKQTPIKITGYGLAAGCQVFYCKIYGFFTVYFSAIFKLFIPRSWNLEMEQHVHQACPTPDFANAYALFWNILPCLQICNSFTGTVLAFQSRLCSAHLSVYIIAFITQYPFHRHCLEILLQTLSVKKYS